MDLNEKIKFYRSQNGMTQRELAELSDIALRSLSYYEKGLRKPSLEVMIKISKALNVPIDEFLDLPEMLKSAKSEATSKAKRAEAIFTRRKEMEKDIIRELIRLYNHIYYNDKYDLTIIKEDEIEEISNFLKSSLELKINEIKSRKESK